MPARYVHVVDPLRKFNPSLTETNLQADEYLGNADIDQVQALIDDASSAFDGRTQNPMRLARTGSPGAPETYEMHDVRGQGWKRPLTVDLDHQNVLPFEAAEGDALELRTGRDSWEDVTAAAGDEFALEPEKGELTLYRWLINRVHWEHPGQRFLRTTYRHGALGGSRGRGGETTLSASATDSETTLSVTNAARLPGSGVVLVGDSEYVRVTGVDYDTDELTVTRGVRATTASSHSDGATVHFCPESVRDAIAGKVAADLVRFDDWTASIVDGDGGVSPERKLDDWVSTFDTVCARHARVRMI